MSRHFCFQRHQPEAKRLPTHVRHRPHRTCTDRTRRRRGRRLSAPWLRPSAAPGPGSPRHQGVARAYPVDGERDLGWRPRGARLAKDRGGRRCSCCSSALVPAFSSLLINTDWVFVDQCKLQRNEASDSVRDHCASWAAVAAGFPRSVYCELNLMKTCLLLPIPAHPPEERGGLCTARSSADVSEALEQGSTPREVTSQIVDFVLS
eukprot:4726261-Prymnesium_polylepis.2